MFGLNNRLLSSLKCIKLVHPWNYNHVVNQQFRTYYLLKPRQSFKCKSNAQSKHVFLYDLRRNLRTPSAELKAKNRATAIYGTAFAIFALAASYASVPLYRLYCQATGQGGRAVLDDDSGGKVENMKPKKDKIITVQFVAEKASSLAWNFKPTQNEVKVLPGETALAFYTARNPLDRPITGVATYSVMPWEAGQYLNKIQCFCFEEQRLNPNEEVDMPVFFYFDPEFADDPRLEDVNQVVLSYTFFDAKEGFKLPFMPKQIYINKENQATFRGRMTAEDESDIHAHSMII